ncbi:MAG: GNAT family N-acetyltransferase [Dysgonomonas sp.]|nr:GNAT family N-acetyltransferase [Dysgonomonas sp.]
MSDIIIREIEEKDNKALAILIRSVFEEFGAFKEGTVFSDPTTDALFQYFNIPDAQYWVAEEDNTLLGGCGIYPTDKLPKGCAELVKFYLSPQARGKGIGSKLISQTIDTALTLGYNQLYLESFPEFGNAVKLYERLGFKYLDGAWGNSGHFACTIHMVKDL